MQHRVSQRDLAKFAGVSPMTVSLALRNHPSIPPTTRARIVKLAASHGYRPDPALSALNAYRNGRAPSRFQGLLAWATAFPSADGWRDMIQAEGYFQGAEKRADELGYKLEPCWLGDAKFSRKRTTQILLTRGIKGILVAPLPPGLAAIDLEWQYFASVMLGYSLQSPRLHVVMNHQSRNMKSAVHHLAELGYRRIGLAMPSDTDDRVDHSYLGGYLIAQHELRGSCSSLKPLLLKPFTRKAFERWMQRQRPDAIIVSAVWVAEILSWLGDQGIHVPRDRGIAVAATPWSDPGVSGIDENAPLIGEMATNALVGMLHRNELGIPSHPWSMLSEGTWLPGTTVRKQIQEISQTVGE